MEEISVFVEQDAVEFDRMTVTEHQQPYQENFYRKLTSFDVEQALFPLIYYDNVTGKPRKSYESEELMLSDEQEDSTSVPLKCCRLRRLDQRFRISLPLARRTQSLFSKHPSVVLCSNCQNLKNEQLKELDKIFNAEPPQRQMEINLITEEEKRSLFEKSTDCQTNEMLVWKLDPLQALISSYDTGSLTDNEKKKLISETIEKLQRILSNQSSMHHQMGTQLTNEALETSIRILQSSIDLNQRFIS